MDKLPNPEKQTLFQDNENEEPADFEKAILAAKWGKFNLMVYAIAITSGWSSMFETTTMSYVFPAAECDLNLSLEHKGLLNAITYIGMITSGFMWGYLSDTLGRKKLLVTGYLLDAVFVLMAATSQTFTLLMIAKFFGGFIINGPFSALATYISELHSSAHRSRAQYLLGVIFTAGTLVLPFLAIQVLPLDFHVELWDGKIVIHSWNLYLFICAFVPLTGGIGFMFLPESPKFLMSTGQNEKALQILKKIYSMNTGNPQDTYPIKTLINEIELQENKYGNITANRSKSKALLEGWQQMKPLFHTPYLIKIILVCIIQTLSMNSLNTLRLWLPQLFQAMNDYELNHDDSAALCDALAVFRPNKTREVEEIECVVNTNNISVYTNSMIVCTVTLVAYAVASVIINKVGNRRLYITLGVISGSCVICLIFSRSTVVTLILASIFNATGSVMINCIMAVIMEMFPTTLRTMAVSLAMMCGRSGAVLGNAVYPLLLQIGCEPPFIYNGILSLSCALLGLLLPAAVMTSLK